MRQRTVARAIDREPRGCPSSRGSTVQPALTLALTLPATFKAQVLRITFVSSFQTAGCRYHLFQLVHTMPSIPHVLALEYLGRRVQQLRADPIRRNSRFFPWGDHLLDDLNILEIPTPDYVHVSRDCKGVEYTWTADSDPRNSHVRRTPIQ